MLPLSFRSKPITKIHSGLAPYFRKKVPGAAFTPMILIKPGAIIKGFIEGAEIFKIERLPPRKLEKS